MCDLAVTASSYEAPIVCTGKINYFIIYPHVVPKYSIAA
jgi:hypothetical protein